MPRELWFDRIGEALTTSGLARYAAPISANESVAPTVSVRGFGPFDAGAGDWKLNTGLRFEMPADSAARTLFALTTGTISYHAGAGTGPGTVVLTRGDVAPAVVLRESGALPAWYPRPGLAVYENVDAAAARTSVLATAGGRFWQTLTFQLRIAADAAERAPLTPTYVHFEDPEYNRRLASSPARSATTVEAVVGEERVSRTLTLAADRRQYNPDGRLAARWDWTALPLQARAALTIRAVDDAGVARTLRPQPADPELPLDDLPAGALVQIRLDGLAEAGTDRMVRLEPGQSLELTLSLRDATGPVGAVVLMLGIVEQPVTPSPEAAYALLRSPTGPSSGQPVECVRFAWGTNPDRVELICPADLRTDVVRRRAVFHLRDVFRIGEHPRYAVQKIARDGATHIPTVAAEPR